MFCISLSNILVYFSAFILSCPFWKELCPTIILHNVLESIVFIIQLLEFVQTIGEKCNKRILVCSVTPHSLFLRPIWLLPDPIDHFLETVFMERTVIAMPYIQGSPPCYLT